MQKLHVAAVDPATGQARASAQLRVFTAWTFNLAALYADDEVTPLPNPLIADSAGRAAFKVADGEYDIEVSGQGFTPYKLTLVQAMDKDGYATKTELENITLGGVTVQMLTYVDAKLEFGAVGNGSVDDWAAIQAAINSRRGPVYLRPGSYRISQPIDLLDSTQLLGAGTHLTTIQPLAAGYNAIQGANVTSVKVSDMTITSPVASANTGQGVSLVNCYYSTLDTLYVLGHWASGIALSGSGGLNSIRACAIENCSYGIAIYTGGGSVAITSCGISNTTYGVYLSASFGVSMYNMIIVDFQSAGIAMVGICIRTQIYGLYVGNNGSPHGVWMTSEQPIVQGLFLGIGIFNTGALAAPVTSTYWLMDNIDIKTNTGIVWATSSIRGWGHLDTTTPSAGATIGIGSILKMGTGVLRINWQSPAVFNPNSYAVTLTGITYVGGLPIIGQVITMASTYVEIALMKADGTAIDGAFCVQAGGNIVV